PGAYWIMLQVQDNSGNMDLISAYAVATPVPPGPDTTPPTASISSPANNAHVSGDVTIAATASDDNSGVKQVDFYRDGSILLGTKTTSPYTLVSDFGAIQGPHTLYVRATDNAGNVGTSPSISIVADAPTLPQISVTSPTDGSTVTRKATVLIQAQVTRTS